MRGAPFLAAFAVTAATVFPLVRERAAVRPKAAVETEPAAFMEPRVDVPHGPPPAQAALRGALGWLSRHQEPDGSWGSGSFVWRCAGACCLGRGAGGLDEGVTALAVLALIEGGDERLRESAERGLRWLEERQAPDGGVGDRRGKFMYGHAIATAALLRGGAGHRAAAVRGVRFLEAARTPGRGWRYGVRDGDCDTSVTFWAARAMAAARAAGIEVDPRAAEGTAAWIEEATRGSDFEAVYRRRGRSERTDGTTAMALAMRLELGQGRGTVAVRGTARRLGWSLPSWERAGRTPDFVAWHAGALALRTCGDAELLEAWTLRTRRALVDHQRRFTSGCASGSWDPADAWGSEGGRVYATAINALTLAALE